MLKKNVRPAKNNAVEAIKKKKKKKNIDF